MTKATATRRIRKYFAQDRGEKLLGALPMNTKMCAYCGLPMYVADGQIQTTHGACRKQYKERYARAKKRKQS